MLDTLAKHQQPYIQAAVAGNPSCTAEILVSLIQGRWLVVRDAALNNPNCPKHLRAMFGA